MIFSAKEHEIFINFEEEISSKSLFWHKKCIEKASLNNKLNVILNFEHVETFSNSLVDFILSIKKITNQINICNLNTTLLPVVYLMQLDKEVKIYTSEYDAKTQTKPIIKRRFKLVSKNAF